MRACAVRTFFFIQIRCIRTVLLAGYLLGLTGLLRTRRAADGIARRRRLGSVLIRLRWRHGSGGVIVVVARFGGRVIAHRGRVFQRFPDVHGNTIHLVIIVAQGFLKEL